MAHELAKAPQRVGNGKTAKVVIDRRTLHDLYILQKLSSGQIAAMYSCSRKTIRRRLREFGIPMRDLKTAFAVSTLHHGNNPTTAESCSWWKGGRTITQGYVRVMDKTHPASNDTGYVLEHRVIMEQYVGRKLKRSEHVHHKNGNRADNRLSNLELLTINQHMSLHMREKHRQGKIPHGRKLA